MTGKKKNFMAPFYGWGSTTSRLEPLRGGSLLFTAKFPEIPGTPTYKKMCDLNVCLQKVKESLGRWSAETEIVSGREVIKYFH